MMMMMMMEGAVSKDIFFAKERPARESCRDTYVLFICVIHEHIQHHRRAHVFSKDTQKTGGASLLSRSMMDS